MKRMKTWIAALLIAALLSGCTDAGSYIKGEYPLIKAEGQGSQVVKIYSAEGKDVPTVARELTAKEKPLEQSKESADQMFLVYQDKIVNLQKDPQNEANTLVEVDSIEYARQNYDSSFLQGFVTAALLQSVLGNSWYSSPPKSAPYRGYTTVYPNVGSSANSAPKPSAATQPNTTTGSGSFSTGKSTAADSVRKNDGSVPKASNGAGSSSTYNKSQPSTSKGSGTFKKRK
ncbi:DUF4247 domain-containing protein [Paenibacillus chartarius]|uniref:DUF4247 domain-containing protein n=1 Tax=Paenibacillus chartarius TaxID=747481 RepID=A0ABV6DMB6_9BACL